MATKKTRGAGTLTEAAYWAKVRSVLRKGFQFWVPIGLARTASRRISQSANKRLKYEQQCAICEGWFAGKDTQVDHVNPVGSLKCGDDLKGFVERLTAEGSESYQVLCKPCHALKTLEERKSR
jgi:hypothetical protein